MNWLKKFHKSFSDFVDSVEPGELWCDIYATFWLDYMMIDFAHIRRTIGNIYHTFRCCGPRLGFRVTMRILFPPKRSKKFQEFIDRVEKEGWIDKFDKGCPDDESKRDV